MKREKELKITYDNLDRDVFFAALVKDGKGRNDFYDTCKCAVWEETEQSIKWSKDTDTLIDFSRGVKLMSNRSWMMLQVQTQKKMLCGG